MKLLDEMKKNQDARYNDSATLIAASNATVDLENARRIHRQAGDLWISKSSDVGCSRTFNKISNCHNVLLLKIGVPVLGTKDMESIAINGARGTIANLSDKKDITVKLNGARLVEFQKVIFSLFQEGRLHTRRRLQCIG